MREREREERRERERDNNCSIVQYIFIVSLPEREREIKESERSE